MNLINKIKSLIFGGIQKKPAVDSGAMTTAQVSYLGQTRDVQQITPYGLACSPPNGSTWLLWQVRGNSNDIAGFGNDYKSRPKGLVEGEAVLFNSKTGTIIKLDASGNVVIESAGVSSNATITVVGGDVIADGISLKTHVHGGVTTGPGNTTTPV